MLSPVKGKGPSLVCKQQTFDQICMESRITHYPRRLFLSGSGLDFYMPYRYISDLTGCGKSLVNRIINLTHLLAIPNMEYFQIGFLLQAISQFILGQITSCYYHTVCLLNRFISPPVSQSDLSRLYLNQTLPGENLDRRLSNLNSVCLGLRNQEMPGMRLPSPRW